MEKPSLEAPLVPSTEEGGGQVLAEVKRQLWLAGPLMTANLLQYIIEVISVMFVGHLGELALAGASMATSFAGVTGFSVLSFGAKQYNMLGIHMQRAMLVVTLVSIPIAIIWAYTTQILMACAQDPEISVEAGFYARWMIATLFAYGPLQCHIKFLQTQNIVFPIMLSSGVTTLLHILVCWILVFKSGLGSKGAALANAISYWFNVFLLALYVRLSPVCRRTWTGLSSEAFHGIFNFIKLAVPSAVMVCLVFWSFELLVLVSGLLPNPKLETSVMSIVLNICSLLFMIPFGLGAAASTRVSNELGAGRPQAAYLAVCIAVFMAITQGLVVGSIIVLFPKVWGYAYSNEEEVVNYVDVMMPILAVANLLDGIQCVLSGTYGKGQSSECFSTIEQLR
ncbi:protein DETOXIFICATION 16 [Cocos nucifera]|uniref:Protein DETOXIFICATION 16 n=1 Tax=Cocos nucifera TaxID=13894 RepID=A0A8K0IH01_COCNU|nr:protein DETOXIFICATION 16 [Cocos nucifera]